MYTLYMQGKIITAITNQERVKHKISKASWASIHMQFQKENHQEYGY